MNGSNRLPLVRPLPRLGALAGALVGALVLAGCSMVPHGPQASGGHERPALSLRYGVLAVSPEPVVIMKTDRSPLTFSAPAGTTFPRNGIEFLGLVVDRNGNPVPPDPKALKDSAFDVNPDGRKAFDCRFDEKKPTEIVCTPTGALAKGVYRYAMRVLKDGKLIESDPHVFSME